jgi:glutamate 5-kinase
VDGLLGPEQGSGAFIPLIEEITPELRTLASGPSLGGRGGMMTKLDAADLAMRSGGIAVIANGGAPHILERIFSGEPAGTVFVSKGRMAGKRRWIAYAGRVRGQVCVNSGAKEAIMRTKASLLASGVVRVEGKFDARDVVSINDEEGREFARGVASLSSAEVALLAADSNHSTPQKRKRSNILITRDNIVLHDDV